MNNIIYVATNQLTGKKYVGQTITTLEARAARHLFEANSGSTTKFHQALRQHGFENFIWEEVPCFLGDLKESENYLIDQYNTINGGYNTVKNHNTQCEAFQMRIPHDMLQAFKEYANEQGKSMSKILKDYIANLI